MRPFELVHIEEPHFVLAPDPGAKTLFMVVYDNVPGGADDMDTANPKPSAAAAS